MKNYFNAFSPRGFLKVLLHSRSGKSDLHGPSLILNNGTVSSVQYQRNAIQNIKPLTVNNLQ
jgi:hypothetical protein